MLSIEIRNINVVVQSIGRVHADTILHQIAKRLLHLPKEILIGYLGESRFILVLPDYNRVQIEDFCNNQLVNLLKEPIKTLQSEFHIEFHIGVDSFPKSQEPGLLVTRSEKALQYAVQNDHFLNFFSHDQKDTMVYNFHILEALPDAIQNDEFDIYLQAKYDLNTNKTIGYELLTRWISPHEGIIHPEVFIPIYETTHAINLFTFFMIEKALYTLVDFVKYSGFFLAFNLSAKTMLKIELIEEVMRIINKSNFPKDKLILEVTESFFLSPTENAIESINRLRNDGSKISVDDFGNGYSSMMYWEKFQLDEIKIDRSLVSEISNNPKRQFLLKGIIDLAHQLEIEVCAEGIETKKDLVWLIENGCNFGQGYYFHKPEPLEKVLKKHSA